MVEIIMADVISTGAEVIAVEAEGMTAKTEVTGVRAGVKSIHPTPPIPKTVSNSSVVIRTTGMEVGWDDQWGQRVDMDRAAGLNRVCNPSCRQVLQ